MTGQDATPSFTLGYVPGVSPGKWARTWAERVPDVPLDLVRVAADAAADLVRDHDADAVLLRLPTDRTGLHAIPLYTETTVVVVPKDHPLATADEVTGDDIADSVVLHPLDDTLDWTAPPGEPALQRPATTRDAVELVAAGVGLLVVPQSLARLHHRRDLVHRPFPGAPRSSVALSWPAEETTDLMEQFIGIVRGRTVNSSRGRDQAEERTPEQRSGAHTRPEQSKPRAAARRRHGGPRHRKPRRR